MLGRLKTVLTLAVAALVLGPAAVAEAQDGGRFRVLVPYFEPLDDADDGFGEDASEELRELIDGLATHRAIPEDDIKDAAGDFDIDMEELDCVRTRQLASQIDAPVAVCASYTEQADGSMAVSAQVWNIGAGESFDIPEFTVADSDDGSRAAAEQVFEEFDRYNTQVRSAAICADYAASQQWENALRNCNEAIEINPAAVSVRYQRARIHYEMENYPEALSELEVVLEGDPFHEDALQLAGYISATTGQNEKARDYYSQYLELRPGDAGVRMNIAYELAQAGDPAGAMDFIQVGLDVDPENVDLWEQYGGFAFAAAQRVQEEQAVSGEDSGAISPAAAEYYREAIKAYEHVYEGRGAETRVSQLRNIISANIQLGEIQPAISFAERVLETHPQEEDLWSIYADALQRADRLDDAITALDRVREINPEHPSAALRQGNWLIQAGRIPEAVEILTSVAQASPQQAEQAGRLIFNDAYQNGYQKENYGYAIEAMSAAKQLPNLPQPLVEQLNFWHGFSLYQQAVQEQAPQTLETAEATLPKFQEALRLLNASGDYPTTVNVQLSDLVENTNTYIEIQEAIIERGGM